jgi:hypothetical protein
MQVAHLSIANDDDVQVYDLKLILNQIKKNISTYTFE